MCRYALPGIQLTTRPLQQPLTANWVLGNIVDIGITVILCWYLWSEKLAVREK